MTVTPYKIVSLNPQGIASKERLNALLYESRLSSVDVLLLQETNLDRAHENKVKEIARHHGYIPCVGWTRANGEGDVSSRGGSAIFVRAATFDLDPRQGLAHDTHLNGRVTCVRVPTPTGELHFASMYIPAQSAARGHFLRKLRTAKLLTRRTVLGVDANMVTDPSIDVFYPPGASTTYSNSHSATFEDTIATTGLRDIYRYIEGPKARAYTRECDTVSTRIDRIIGPTTLASHEWISIRVNASFGRSVSNPDHRALEALIGPIDRTQKGKPPPSIRKTTYSTPQAIQAIEELFRDITRTYNPREYGYAVVHEYFKSSARDLLLQLSSDSKYRPTGTALLLKRNAQELAENRSQEPPSAERVQHQRNIANALKEARRANGVPRGKSAQSIVDREERCTKPFHKRYRPTLAKKHITQLHRMEGTSPVTPQPDNSHLASGIEELSSVAAGFYEALMCEKPCDMNAARPMLEKLSSNPIPKKAAASIEGAITEKEVRTSIRSMAKGKACGPDGLHAEFYRTHENLLLDFLTHTFNEMHAEGSLTDSMRRGNIILLYKKKDPYDIRNYRPITLLNADYKVMTKILVARLKLVVADFVSRPQTGFVPQRQITDNTMLCKLIQAYLDETDEEGLLLFLDIEKAFDSVSHEYLYRAAKAAGLGKDMMQWIDLLYNPAAPMYRRTQVNGHHSDYFPIKSGVAQGCPLSPILFLFVTEGLTRLIQDHTDYHGIVVNGTEHRLSQFADDTVLFLRNYANIPLVFDTLLPNFQAATGLKVNVTKTEGLRLGRLRHTAPPDSLPPGIQWCPEGQYIISLGVPIGNAFDERAFWLTKYHKCKSLVAHWHDIPKLTVLGRAMLANNMIFSRFRYWAQTMHMPDDISRALTEDVQAMVWGKDPEFDQEELGTQLCNNRWIHSKVQFLPSNEGGLSLLHWQSHVKAIEAHVWFKYRDATRGPWKDVLDSWVGSRHDEGRGAPFTTRPAILLLKSLTHRQRALPKFFTSSLRHLRTLHLTPTSPGRYTSTDEASAEPVWWSHRHTIKSNEHAQTWRDQFELIRLLDFTTDVAGERSTWTREQIEGYFEPRVHEFSKEALKFFKWPKQIPKPKITRASLASQFFRMADEIGYHKIKLTYTPPSPLTDPRYSEFCRREIRRQGWLGPQGGGLGARCQGITEPIVIPRYKNGKPVKVTKASWYDTLAAVTTPDGETIYGYPREVDGDEVFDVVQLDQQGRPLLHTLDRHDCSHNNVRKLLRWNGGAIGVAELSYPHPEGWTLDELGSPIPLDRLRIRHLTLAFRNVVTIHPTCRSTWESKLGLGELPFHLVWQRLQHPCLTNPDRKNNLRIINRSLYTRSWANPSAACRLCGNGHDRLSHLSECPTIQSLFSIFEDPPSPQMIYLGLYRNLTPVTGSTALLYTLTWKYALVQYTRVDVEGDTFETANIYSAALSRMATRLEAYSAELRAQLERHRSRGDDPPPSLLRRYRKTLAPDASVDDNGRLTLNIDTLNAMSQIRCYPCNPPATYEDPPELDPSATNFTYARQAATSSWSSAILAKALEDEATRHNAARASNTEYAKKSTTRRKAGHT